MTIISKINLPIFIYCFLFISQTIKAQNRVSDADKSKILFNGNHFSFNLSWLVATKADIEKQTGNYPVSSSAVPGGKLGMLYHINFNSNFSIHTGMEAVIIGTNFILAVHKNDFSPPLTQDYFYNGKQTRAGNLLLSLPLAVEKRFWYGKKNFISAEAGVYINYSLGPDADIRDYIVANTSDSAFSVAQLNVNANNDAKPWVSYMLGAAHSWHLNNNNYFQAGIQANISFTKYIKGSYILNIPNQPQTINSYSSTGTYFSLFLRYRLTNGNYRLRKQYQNMQ